MIPYQRLVDHVKPEDAGDAFRGNIYVSNQRYVALSKDVIKGAP